MKKMRNSLLGLAVAGLLFLSSCSIVMPLGATGNTIGSKVGTSKATLYLAPAPMGIAFDQDASIQTAAKNGGITKISTVDVKQGSVLGIIYTVETIVTGN